MSIKVVATIREGRTVRYRRDASLIFEAGGVDADADDEGSGPADVTLDMHSYCNSALSRCQASRTKYRVCSACTRCATSDRVDADRCARHKGGAFRVYVRITLRCSQEWGRTAAVTESRRNPPEKSLVRVDGWR